MTYFYYIAASILALAGTWLDIFHTSTRFKYYGLTEANSLLRDQYKNIDLNKAWLLYSAFFVAAGALFLVHWFAGVALLVVIAFKGFWHGFDNLSVMKRKRKEQIAKLRELRGLLADERTTVYFWGGQRFEVRSGRAAFSLFRWIYVDGVDDLTQEAARLDLARRIEELTSWPESEWFPT